MKATVNGISVEGTPQEIVNYVKLMDDLRREGTYIKPQLGSPPDWILKQLNITSGSVDGYKGNIQVNNQGKCPNQGQLCYCTGACK